MRRESFLSLHHSHPHPPLCLTLSVDASKDGAFLTEPPPGEAWVGTSAEFRECPWELGVMGASAGQGGQVHRPPASAGVAYAVPPSCKHSPLETDWVCFLQSS